MQSSYEVSTSVLRRQSSHSTGRLCSGARRVIDEVDEEERWAAQVDEWICYPSLLNKTSRSISYASIILQDVRVISSGAVSFWRMLSFAHVVFQRLLSSAVVVSAGVVSSGRRCFFRQALFLQASYQLFARCGISNIILVYIPLLGEGRKTRNKSNQINFCWKSVH